MKQLINNKLIILNPEESTLCHLWAPIKLEDDSPFPLKEKYEYATV